MEVDESIAENEEMIIRLEDEDYNDNDAFEYFAKKDDRNRNSIRLKIKIASHKKTNSDVLKYLSEDEAFEVRKAILSTTRPGGVPKKILEALLEDEDEWVNRRANKYYEENINRYRDFSIIIEEEQEKPKGPTR